METILEVRFVTSQNWLLLPGLLYNHIAERYEAPVNLPNSSIPEDIRKSDPQLTYLPVVSFVGKDFSVNLGPRVISLNTKAPYPGWGRIREEFRWLLDQVAKAGFLNEGERLGLRYIDFFAQDIFSSLVIYPQCAGKPVTGVESSLTMAFEKERFQARLILSNSVFTETGAGPRSGSVLDLDLSLSASEFDPFENGLECFDDANRVNKEIFFGLLRPEFLSTLAPEYD